jgi:hypothetical protein
MKIQFSLNGVVFTKRENAIYGYGIALGLMIGLLVGILLIIR